MSVAMTPKVDHGSSIHELEALFRQHYRLIYQTAHSITGTRQDAEDVLQTIFLRLLKRESLPVIKSNPQRYFYKSAVNAALTITRGRQRQRLADGVEVPEAPAPEPAGDDNERIEQGLIEAMAQLPAEQVEILILRYQHGRSDAEIGKMLGRSRVSIAVTLHRARARLRKLLDEAMGEKI